ncbi:MAG: hypothetical protein HY730_07515 [Candidatus Tectomicrobia bacterium]|uniref:Uncharacterized protein n=1 Tax=Tectimicrobiota bacterium TaxID=2528274 RepID=A0A933LQJ1_UNCTE|nr:hypothetical protein [Candidatus Tectomicrobia bacterium]
MSDRHPGLTPEIAAFYHQAARVCLDRHHVTPTQFLLQEEQTELVTQVEWEPADNRSRAAWANEIDTTEAGAYACSLAATELMRGLVAVRRAETGTGADYYIGPTGRAAEDLEDCYRLEVSGTDRGSKDGVMRRLQQKVAQTLAGNSNLPALAAVVGFQAQLILIQAVEDES